MKSERDCHTVTRGAMGLFIGGRDCQARPLIADGTVRRGGYAFAGGTVRQGPLIGGRDCQTGPIIVGPDLREGGAMDGWAGLSDGAIRRRAGLSGGGLFLFGRETVSRGAMHGWTGLSGLGYYLANGTLRPRKLLQYFLVEGENARPFVHLNRWYAAALGLEWDQTAAVVLCALFCFLFCAA